MDIWKILEIDKTSDKSAIKKAYRQKLKQTRPDDDEKAFIELRKAYECALEYTEYYAEYDEDEDYDEEGCDEDYDGQYDDSYYDEFSAEEEIIEPDEYYLWEKNFHVLMRDVKKRTDVSEWINILYNDIPYKLQYYTRCKSIVNQLLFNRYQKIYLPKQSWDIIDTFFSFSTEDELVWRTSGYTLTNQKYINDTVRAQFMVDFKQLIITDKMFNMDKWFEYFEKLYNELSFKDEITENALELIDILKKENVKYLPFICMDMAYRMDSFEEEDYLRRINILSAEYGHNHYIELLKVKRHIHKQEYDSAVIALQVLYKSAPMDNIAFVYDIMECCRNASMYYESYMLLKHMTWMEPKGCMQELADKLTKSMEKSYKKSLKSKKGATNLEHIRMCRMYLRANREKEALKTILLASDDADNIWEYHMARCLAYFSTDDISPCFDSYEILQKYDKNELCQIERLEWEELQGRYLLETKKYKECIEKCNELLKRYPNSFPILMLREYADYHDGKFNLSTRYADMGQLLHIFPKRAEIVLFLFEEYGKGLGYEEALKLLKPVKKICEIQYRYCEAQIYERTDRNKYLECWKNIIDLIRTKELYIEPVSKYGLVDLRFIHNKALNLGFCTDGHYFWENYMLGMEDGEYNEPKKYIDFPNMYSKTGETYKAIDALKELIKKASGKEYAIYQVSLICNYCVIGETELIEDEIKGINEKEFTNNGLSSIYYEISRMYLNIGKYEKAEEYILKSIEYAPGYINKYVQAAATYEMWGHSNPDKYKAGIDIINQGFSYVGKYRAGSELSPYRLISMCYVGLGDIDKAKKALDDMYKYAKNEIHRMNYNLYMAYMYELAFMPQQSYEYHIKSEEYGMTSSISKLSMMMALKMYKEVYDKFWEFTKTDEDPAADFWICILHCKFIMDGELSEEFIKFIEEKIYEKININGGENEGQNYYYLAEVNRLLGNVDKEKYYENIGDNYKWRDIETKKMYVQEYNIFKFWLKKDYEGAYKYAKSVDYYRSHFELKYIRYYLHEMFEMEG